MISRESWRDAIRSSGLPASRRAVLNAMADFWPRGTIVPVIWATQGELAARTGLSPATIKRAWIDGQDAGLLVLVERHRQHRAPRWAPTLPDQTGHGDRSEPVDNPPQGGQPDRSEDDATTPRPVTVHSQTGHSDRRIQKNQNHHHQAPSSTSLAAAQLAMVVVDELPATLAGSVRRKTLAAALAAAEAAGWTGEQLRAAARARDWTGARAGLVVEWARELGAPPAPAAARLPEQRCSTHGTTYQSVCSSCRADLAADPRPLGERIASRLAGTG